MASKASFSRIREGAALETRVLCSLLSRLLVQWAYHVPFRPW